MIDNPEIEKILDKLFKNQHVYQCIVAALDGSPLVERTRRSTVGDELYVLPAAVTSALAISEKFMNENLNDHPLDYIVFQEDAIVVATLARDTILITRIIVPKSSFEERPPMAELRTQLREAADHINAIIKTLDIEDSLIERLKRSIPEAEAILIFTTVGAPLSEFLAGLDVDPAQLAAVSSALSLPTKVMGGTAQSIAVTGKTNTLLLYTMDAERILLVALKPKHSIETYLTRISRLVNRE
ncbi:MAG: hypothetical protein ACFFE8_00980 [Candidatus Heimdallarchaeota archaeon]